MTDFSKVDLSDTGPYATLEDIEIASSCGITVQQLRQDRAIDDLEAELADVLPAELFDHPDCFNSQTFARWEQEVATPALVSAGFIVGLWRSTDADSFGPLVRAVELTKDGITKTYYYG